MTRLHRSVVLMLVLGSGAHGQLSPAAYRVLGQIDFRQAGVNMVQGVELSAPSAVALDSRNGQLHIYISDTRNARVLAWSDVATYQAGDPPTLVLGQPGPQYSGHLGIGPKGFEAPWGLAVDARTGNLYVADFPNNRVLRFPSPFGNAGRIEPDAVYGQTNFTARASGSSSSSLNQPRGAAVDSSGNLWIADTGNHRVVRFSASVLDSPAPVADTVIGQKDFLAAAANAGGTSPSGSGLDTPVALAFDAQDNLYVSDFNNTRVLRFPAPLGPSTVNPSADAVWGETNFATRGVPQQASASTMAGPAGLTVDASGNLYVAVPADNRVLVFPANTALGATARSVMGQSDFVTTAANAVVSPVASPNTLSAPGDVKVDANGNVYLADTGNNRVLRYVKGSKSGSLVWGQSDFTSHGPNQIKPGSINYPYKIAVDYSATPFALYVSDAANHRILVWKDSVRFRSGDPADLVIGQPDLRTASPNSDSPNSRVPSRTSLSSPTGVEVSPTDGTMYVADSGNNRVLRYPRPVDQASRIAPDAVIGQSDFITSTSAAVTASSMNSPGAIALGPNGNLFVSDTGNNRVLEFAAGARNGAAAIRVYGQPAMTTSVRASQVSPQTLLTPLGIAVDQASNLYVVDAGAGRVLIFPNTGNAPASGMVAAFVLGQADFGTTANGSFKAPTDVAVDSSGRIYVCDSGANRVPIFRALIFLPVAGATAIGVVGQQSLSGTAPNADSLDGLATAGGLSSPVGLHIDRQDTLYVADAGNSRVLHFLKAASIVNVATYQLSAPVARGGLVALFGADLAVGTATGSDNTWKNTLLNRQVVLSDEIAVPLYYVGASQANFQIPSNAQLGSGRVAMRVADTGELIAGGTLVVAAVSPGLFTTNQNGSGQAAVYNQDNTLNSPSNPAARGSVVTLYGTGQGQVSPSLLDGTPAPSSPLSNTVAIPTSDAKTCQNNQPSVCVLIGTSFGEVQFSGLAPGFIGLWQLNVKIPQDVAPGGAVSVRAVINATPSNVVTVAIR